MKQQFKILLLLLLPLAGMSQFKISRSDIAPMSCTLAAGLLQGTREQVLYHPNALFRQFPGLDKK
ncbi:MAG: hypothetical protein H7320_16955, partial [Ferruginibacter sp.]|nr:hypothetical protein [Ferruginibacter sp.]